MQVFILSDFCTDQIFDSRVRISICQCNTPLFIYNVVCSYGVSYPAPLRGWYHNEPAKPTKAHLFQVLTENMSPRSIWQRMNERFPTRVPHPSSLPGTHREHEPQVHLIEDERDEFPARHLFRRHQVRAIVQCRHHQRQRKRLKGTRWVSLEKQAELVSPTFLIKSNSAQYSHLT